jgi:hypothetical protein
MSGIGVMVGLAGQRVLRPPEVVGAHVGDGGGEQHADVGRQPIRLTRLTPSLGRTCG